MRTIPVAIALWAVYVAIGIAIFRYRLYDIDRLINRTVVYGLLTAGGVGVYVAVVKGAEWLLAEGVGLGGSLLATAVVAVSFAPARDRLQRWVDRRLYGERHDPVRAMARLGERLRDAPGGDVLAGVLQAVCETLRLPSATLRVEDGWRWRPTAGQAHASESIPLEHEGQQVGALLVSPRTGEQTLGVADRRVLEVLAVPVAVALHAVLLSQELQRSRERLVAAREEERRRLRRDLHDGLGPILTAVTLKADAARSVLAATPDRADGLLAELRGDANQAIGDLRRIIYDLRPAPLDELGLLGALGEQVDRFARQGLSVTLQAPPALPVLPAAVEVAAYRIVTEALTNAARHAHASHASVTVSVDDGFCLDVQDDGTASTANGNGWRPGVGLAVHGRTRRRGRRHPPGRPNPNRRPGPRQPAVGAGMTIRVLIADDHPLVRQGLQAALAPLPEVEVVAEAATGQAAIREAVLHQPDVVVMDLQMPDLNGIDATRELARAAPHRGGAGPDHVRRRRLGVRGHARRRPRLCPQGRRTTRDRPGHHGRGRRGGHLRPRRRHPDAGLLRHPTGHPDPVPGAHRPRT